MTKILIDKFDWGHSMVEAYLDLGGDFSKFSGSSTAVVNVCFDETEKVVLVNDDTVGGHIEVGESVEDALRRETLEECGMEIENYRYFGHYKTFLKNSAPEKFKSRYSKISYILFFVSKCKKVCEPFGKDVEKVEFLDRGEVLRLKSDHKMLIEGINLYPNYLF